MIDLDELPREYREGFRSCMRTLANADPDKLKAIFLNVASDVYSWNKLDKQICVDIVEDLGEAHGLDREFMRQAHEWGADAIKRRARNSNGHNGADGAGVHADMLESVCAADVKMRAIRWLLPNPFALGKIGIIGGLPDRGKGCITADMIARVTTGADWPCCEGAAVQGNVLVLTAEDDLEDTIIPRLVAAGADMRRVHILQMVRTKIGRRQFSLVTDLGLLENKLKEISGVVLVVIDPLSAYLGVNKVDTYRASDVRGMLVPIKELVERYLTCIVGIMHFNKNANVTSAMLRLADSLAFVAASRHAYVVVDEPDTDRRLLVKAKNNVAAQNNKGLAYNIEGIIVGQDEHTHESILAPRVVWALDHVEITADQALAAEAGNGKNDEPSAEDEAIEFLREKLAAGPVPVRDVAEHAKALMIAPRTLKRARAKLGVVSEKSEFDGGWILKMLEGGQDRSKGAIKTEWPPSDNLAPFAASSEVDRPPHGNTTQPKVGRSESELKALLDDLTSGLD